MWLFPEIHTDQTTAAAAAVAAVAVQTHTHTHTQAVITGAPYCVCTLKVIQVSGDVNNQQSVTNEDVRDKVKVKVRVRVKVKAKVRVNVEVHVKVRSKVTEGSC